MEWKAKALDYLFPEVQGIVDDSKNLISALPKNYPGTIFRIWAGNLSKKWIRDYLWS